eukprot:13917409-Ditylum_brightwellii.AAC.1
MVKADPLQTIIPDDRLLSQDLMIRASRLPYDLCTTLCALPGQYLPFHPSPRRIHSDPRLMLQGALPLALPFALKGAKLETPWLSG